MLDSRSATATAGTPVSKATHLHDAFVAAIVPTTPVSMILSYRFFLDNNQIPKLFTR